MESLELKINNVYREPYNFYTLIGYLRESTITLNSSECVKLVERGNI